MKTVYKYELRSGDQTLLLPEGALILTVQEQYNKPHLWALVDLSKSVEPRKILLKGTGHEANAVGRYISTFQLDGGALVFHAFEA